MKSEFTYTVELQTQLHSRKTKGENTKNNSKARHVTPLLERLCILVDLQNIAKEINIQPKSILFLFPANSISKVHRSKDSKTNSRADTPKSWHCRVTAICIQGQITTFMLKYDKIPPTTKQTTSKN